MNVSYIANVTGRVQGVYFRASSQQFAIDHDISGYAKNLADGSVEVFMSGEQTKVQKMLTWLLQGPEEATVVNVDHRQVNWIQHNFFSIG